MMDPDVMVTILFVAYAVVGTAGIGVGLVFIERRPDTETDDCAPQPDDAGPRATQTRPAGLA